MVWVACVGGFVVAWFVVCLWYVGYLAVVCVVLDWWFVCVIVVVFAIWVVVGWFWLVFWFGYLCLLAWGLLLRWFCLCRCLDGFMRGDYGGRLIRWFACGWLVLDCVRLRWLFSLVL